jgi:hypothetical protein
MTTRQRKTAGALLHPVAEATPIVPHHEGITRRRINIARSVRGIRTWDCTVDSDQMTLDQLVAASDQMVALLEVRYPLMEVEK